MGVSTPASAMFPITPPPHSRSKSVQTILSQPTTKTRLNRRNMDDTYELYPLPLKHVKALFLHEQYRQCLLACRQLLLAEPNLKEQVPLHYTFVVFYLAMAHEELARKMDDNSHMKVSAFNQAEQFYQDAMSALPTGEEAQALAERHYFANASRIRDDVSEMQLSYRSSSPIGSVNLQDFPVPGPEMRRNTPSPPTHIRDGTPDHSDNESQESFGDVMTPNRVLRRDFLRRSLIASPTKPLQHARPRSFYGEVASPTKPLQHARPRSFYGEVASPTKPLQHSRPRSFYGEDTLSLPRTTSNMSVFQTSTKQELPRTTSHSLLRPVRLGSPAKPYTQIQPILTNTTVQRSRLSMIASPLRAQSTHTVCQTIDEDEDPISPLGPAELTRASTLSPVSSISSFDTAMGTPCHHEEEEDYQPMNCEYLAHLEGMQTQIETHLQILKKARDNTLAAQATTKLERPEEGPTSPAPLPVSQTRYTHALESKAADKKRRLVAGRERQWLRDRFDPTRYQDLAEKALAELY